MTTSRLAEVGVVRLCVPGHAVPKKRGSTPTPPVSIKIRFFGFEQASTYSCSRLVHLVSHRTPWSHRWQLHVNYYPRLNQRKKEWTQGIHFTLLLDLEHKVSADFQAPGLLHRDRQHL